MQNRFEWTTKTNRIFVGKYFSGRVNTLKKMLVVLGVNGYGKLLMNSNPIQSFLPFENLFGRLTESACALKGPKKHCPHYVQYNQQKEV